MFTRCTKSKVLYSSLELFCWQYFQQKSPGEAENPFIYTLKIILLEGEAVRQLRDLPYHNPTSRRTQRNKHGA